MSDLIVGIGDAASGGNDWFNLFMDISQLAGGNNSKIIDGPRLDQFQLLGAGEGQSIPQIFGRMRIGGHLLFVGKIIEHVKSHASGGKGGPNTVRNDYSYSASFAVGLCEGTISQVGRIWADGQELDPSVISFHLNDGSQEQLPDPILQTELGDTQIPAFRGLAYVVFDRFDLTAFGNRIPQLSFEVFGANDNFTSLVKAINIIPGATEFGYDPEPHVRLGKYGQAIAENTHASSGQSDWTVSLNQLQQSCQSVEWVSLVVTWFGTDLRAAKCSIQPCVELHDCVTHPSEWSVAGLSRWQVREVSRVDDRPAFGGTPSDASVIRAIRDLRARGYKVLFYPFVMMDIKPGNNLPDPYGRAEQGAYPWRGHISSMPAALQNGSAQRTAEMRSQIQDFFDGSEVNGWGLNRMVRHYADICAQAGGVDGFLLASEMKGLSIGIDDNKRFPFAENLQSLAAEVRALLPTTKISYAADWSEYGFTNIGLGFYDFPLDAFWGDPNCDFVGIDAYFPLSDWRDEMDHADRREGALSIYDTDYLQSQVRGGENFDYYYASDEDRKRQIRTPINDDWYNGPLWRSKDILAWWERDHIAHGADNETQKTAWVKKSKPIWFTEIGCPAVDKGSNQPYQFPDHRSGNLGLPFFSNGDRDDHIQRQYLSSLISFYSNPANNPVSQVYNERMIPAHGYFIWAWDARPFPAFPFLTSVWSDGPNWQRGHWLNGRLASARLSEMVNDLLGPDISLEANGVDMAIEGYRIDQMQPRRDLLEPLLKSFALDAIAGRSGVQLVSRGQLAVREIEETDLVRRPGRGSVLFTLGDTALLPHILHLQYFRADDQYQPAVATALRPDGSPAVARVSIPFVMGNSRALTIAGRLLQEVWDEQKRLELAVSWRHADLEPTDIIRFRGEDWRIVSIRYDKMITLETVSYAPWLYQYSTDLPMADIEFEEVDRSEQVINVYRPEVILLDIPSGWPARPSSASWPAGVPVIAAIGDPFPTDLILEEASQGWQVKLSRASAIGETRSILQSAACGVWIDHSAFELELFTGQLESRASKHVLAGANVLAVETSLGWEVIQFKNAELIGINRYRISGVLRGQAGSDYAMVASLGAGARCVLIDTELSSMPLQETDLANGLELHYGPASMARDSYAWQSQNYLPQYSGARCLSPVHIRAFRLANQDIRFTWIRRSREGAEDFEAFATPLDQPYEEYQIQLWYKDTLLRQETSPRPDWVYTRNLQVEDGFAEGAVFSKTSPIRFEVAQVSSRHGAGFSRLLEI